MAIIVKTYPGTFQSVHDDLIYVVHEATKANDPVTYPDYRYIADVYVGASLVTRLKGYPDPVTKMGIFNISNILRNYITPVFNPLPTTFHAQEMNAGEWNVSGTVVFGEEYGFVLFPATIAGVGRTFFGHYNGRKLGTLTNLSAYYGKAATVRPDRTPVYRSSANNFIPYFQNVQTLDTLNFEVRTYRADGTQGMSLTSASTGANLSMNIFNASPSAINAFILPIFDDDTAWFTLDFTNNPQRLLTFDLVCETKYTVYSLHFLNRFGGFESRDFTKVSRKLLDIEKKDFGKLPYTVDAAGLVAYYNSNNVYNETRSVYSSQYKEKMTLNTDVLTDGEYTWLADLILSPMVYIEMSGYFIPVVVTRNNYEFKKTVNDKVTNLSLDIEFGDSFSAQWR